MELSRRDGELARLARSGDHGALTALYERHFPAVFDFLARLLRDRNEAAAAAQAAFTHAVERLGELEAPDRFGEWLLTCAHAEAQGRTAGSRRIRREPVSEEEDRLLVILDEQPTGDPAGAGAVREMAGTAWEMAAALNAGTYAVLHLHVRRGIAAAGIARVMATTPLAADTMVASLERRFPDTTRLLAGTDRESCADLAALAPPTAARMTPVARRRVECHVARCEVCRRTVGAAVATYAALEPVPVPARLDRFMRQVIAARAAGAAVAAGGRGTVTTGRIGSGVVAAPLGGDGRAVNSGGWLMTGMGAAIVALLLVTLGMGSTTTRHLAAAGLAPTEQGETAPRGAGPSPEGTAPPSPLTPDPQTATVAAGVVEDPSVTAATATSSLSPAPVGPPSTVVFPPPATTIPPPPTDPPPTNPPPTNPPPTNPPPTTPPPTTPPPTTPPPTTTAPPPAPTVKATIVAPLAVAPPLLCSVPVVVTADVVNPGLAKLTFRADYEFRSGGGVTGSGSRSMQSSLPLIPGIFSIPVDLDGSKTGKFDVTLRALTQDGTQAAATTIDDVAVTCL